MTGAFLDQLLEVRTRDLANLGGLIDAALANGAAHVDGVQFEADDGESVRAAARSAAFRIARSRAEHTAREAGMSLGGALSIEEFTIDFRPATDAGVQTPVILGRSSTEARLRVTWTAS